MFGPFTSAPAWSHGQGQEEPKKWSEEDRHVPGLQTILVVSPGAEGIGATCPDVDVVMLCAAKTLQYELACQAKRPPASG